MRFPMADGKVPVKEGELHEAQGEKLKAAKATRKPERRQKKLTAANKTEKRFRQGCAQKERLQQGQAQKERLLQEQARKQKGRRKAGL